MNTLPASVFKPGMKVIGIEGEVKIMGRVSEGHPDKWGEPDEVLVRWSDECYDDPSEGHFAPAELLQVWPRAAHEALLARHNTAP